LCSVFRDLLCFYRVFAIHRHSHKIAATYKKVIL
jgi:hypothetical protein